MYFLKQVFLPNSHFFRRKTFLGANISWELVLCNQPCSIYTWKDFPLTIIYSFKYSMIYSDFQIPQFFIAKISKQCINSETGCVTNITFQKVGSNCSIFKQPSKNSPNEFRSISGSKNVCNDNLLKLVKN